MGSEHFMGERERYADKFTFGNNDYDFNDCRS